MAPPIGFVPQVSNDVPWHTRQHIELLYQKLNNHAVAFTQIANSLKAAGTTNTTIENFGGGSGGGGGASKIVGLGGVNNQTGNVAYTTAVSDNGVLLVLDDASPVAVTLSTGVSSPWMVFVENLGAGTVTFTPMSGDINNTTTLTLATNTSALIVYDGTDFWATTTPIFPQSFTAPAHEFLTSYNAATGVFTAAQPAFTDVSGRITAAQLPAAGISVTYVTAALTVGGTQGSLTFVDGQLTAQVPAT